MSARLDWKSAVLGAVLAVITGMVLFKLQEKTSALAYSSNDAIPFRDSTGAIAIYDVIVRASGDLPVRNIIARMAVADGRIERGAVDADPTIKHTDRIDSAAVQSEIAVLNPRDEVRLSAVARSKGVLPIQPSLSVRGEGIVATRLDPRPQETHGVLDLLSVIAVTAAATLLLRSMLRPKTPLNHDDTKGAPVLSALAQPPVIGQEAKRIVRPYGGSIFKSGPMPEGFEHLAPGLRLSVLLAAIREQKPRTQLGSITLEITDGPFWQVAFFHETREHDPIVTRVVFYMRKQAVESVRADAVRAFGGTGATTSALGQQMSWDDVDGFGVSFAPEWLSIELRRK